MSTTPTDAFVRIRTPTPNTDTSGLTQLLQVMAAKIESQDAEIARQAACIETLMLDVRSLQNKSNDQDAAIEKLERELTALKATQTTQQCVDRSVVPSAPSVPSLSLEGSPSRANYQRPKVGVELLDTPEGLYVQSVMPGGPASLGGLLPEDFVTAVNGQDCRQKKTFLEILERSSIGQEMDVSYFRNGRQGVARVYVLSGSKGFGSP